MKIKNLSLFAVACIAGLLILGMKSAFAWKSSEVNWSSKRSIASSIYDATHRTCNFVSMGNAFVVNYVEHAGKDCLNPDFPAIHITTKAEYTAWMQVVRTDSVVSAWQEFIDTPDKERRPEDYEKVAPFYSLGEDFYDAVSWHYTLFQKPLSFWRGHAYAVHVDREAKTITCVGGISWGYELSQWRILPKCTVPCALTEQDWEKDWELFCTALSEYNPPPLKLRRDPLRSFE